TVQLLFWDCPCLYGHSYCSWHRYYSPWLCFPPEVPGRDGSGIAALSLWYSQQPQLHISFLTCWNLGMHLRPVMISGCLDGLRATNSFRYGMCLRSLG